MGGKVLRLREGEHILVPKGRKVEPSRLRDVPVVTISPAKTQITFTRDAMAALGLSRRYLWTVYKEQGRVVIRLIAAEGDAPGSYRISARNRSTGMSSVPVEIRQLLDAGNYWATGWKVGRYLDFSPASRRPRLEEAESGTALQELFRVRRREESWVEPDVGWMIDSDGIKVKVIPHRASRGG